MSILKHLCPLNNLKNDIFYSINILYWDHEYRNVLILICLFFIQQITCVTDRARCFDLSGKFSNSLFIIFAFHLEQRYWFFKAKHQQKNPPALLFHPRRSSLHPSRYSSFIHISISTHLASLVWPAVNALLRDPKTNRESFKFIDTTLGGDAHQPWQHNGRFKHAF